MTTISAETEAWSRAVSQRLGIKKVKWFQVCERPGGLLAENSVFCETWLKKGKRRLLAPHIVRLTRCCEVLFIWKALQRGLPRREACRRMVDLLFMAHDQACEAELAHLLAEDLAAGRLPDPKALLSRLSPKLMMLPQDVAVAHPSLDSFDALLGTHA